MPLRVEPVRDSKDLHRFVTYPWSVYRDDPVWVPPLIGDTKKIFDPSKNPFHQHGEIQPYLAIRDDRVVGRIAAIRNRNHESYHNESVGFFGFMECDDDVDVARALLETVKEFARDRGLTSIRGPVNPSTNEECGFLVDGFEHPPMVMMTHGRPYYDRLLKAAGMSKAKDLLAYVLHHTQLPDRLARGAEIVYKRNPDLVVRPLEKKRFRAEVEIFKTIYNAAWEKNWGFVPMTDPEIDHMADQLKQIIDPGMVRIAEKDGKPVAVALGLPDVNQALRHANGKLFPLGLIKILWHARKINQARIAVLGVLPEHRRSGIDVVLYRDLYAYGTKKGYQTGEFSWVLEDNAAIMQPLEKFGGRVYKTYRLYETAVGGN